MHKRRNAIALLSALLIGALIWWQPLLLGRLMMRPDTTTHLRWNFEFLTGLQEGILYPRWAFASHAGLGDPTFIYYQPLLYYVSAAFSLLHVSASKSLMLASTVPYALLAWIGYREHADRFGSTPAFVAAVLLASSPGIYFIATNGGALPWAFAMPWCVLFVFESVRDRPRLLPIALLLAAVCLSHLLSGLIVLLCTGAARFWFARQWHRTWRAQCEWALGVALGLGLGAVFIAPAVSAQALINSAAWTADPSLDWHRAFAFPVLTWRQYGVKWFSFQWVLPVCGLLTAVVAARLLGHPRFADQAGNTARRVLLVAVIALVFSSELAYPLYALLGPMQKLQWPYRFIPLAIVLATFALLRPALATMSRSKDRPQKLALPLVLLALLVHGGLAMALQYQNFSGRETIPAQAAVMAGDFGQPEYLPAGSPPGWQPYLSAGGLDAECTAIAAHCSALSRSSHALAVKVALDQPARLRLPLFAYPAWRILVDGQPSAVEADPKSGLIVLGLDAGSHAIDIRWAGLPVQRVGNMISAVSLGLVCLLCLLNWLRRQRGQQYALPGSPTQPVPVAAVQPAAEFVQP